MTNSETVTIAPKIFATIVLAPLYVWGLVLIWGISLVWFAVGLIVVPIPMFISAYYLITGVILQ